MKECKRCLLLEAAENDTFSLIADKIALIPQGEKTDPDTYDKRLKFCKECDWLISGVCMKCGCYVEFRAAYRHMRCPNVSDRKW